MARPREFDPDVALRSAMELFWANGYEATSMTDLVDHLGIARASLYATFGSKHELYLRALERYQQEQDPQIGDLLARPGPVLPAVRELFEIYLQASVGEDRARGCYLVNAAIERAPTDGEVAGCVRNAWDGMETALTTALLRARATGELASDKDPVALARLFVTVLQGMRVIGKASTRSDRLHSAAEQALAVLE